MEIFFIIILLVFISLITILLKKRIVVEVISLFGSFIVLFLSFVIALRISNTGVNYVLFNFFSIDSLGAIIIVIISLIGLGANIYSIPFFRKEIEKNIIGFSRVKQYFIFLNLFLASMFLAVSSSNPVLSWIFIEATTLSTAFLISFYDKSSSIEAAWKYLIINSVGLLLGFFGMLLYFTSISYLSGNGLISWDLLLNNISNLDPIIAKIAFVFILIGFGTKVGFVPMHTWKPDAYSKAPAPLGALLSGALLPIAFFMILKFKTITDIVTGPLFTRNLLIFFGLISIAVSSLIMLNSKNYKRFLAYSSIENAGIMALGFGFGGIGVFAAILHMIYHSFVKSVMFFSAGNLLLKYNSDKIDNIKGALKVLPATSVSFIIGFLIVTGVPPFGIFLTKVNILSVGIKIYPIITFVALFFMSIVFVAFLKHISNMFFSEKDEDMVKEKNNIWLTISPIIFIVLLIVLSFYIPPFLSNLINNSVLIY